MKTAKERPILFSGAMIRAILNGQKTQTRRVAKGALEAEQCPYGKPGDRLWVRETWAPVQAYNGNDPGILAIAAGSFYRADGEMLEGEIDRWRPSIYMPRAASRILLEVTGVRAERLQDISAQDAIAEGWPGETLKCCGDGCAYDGINSREIIQATGQDDDAPVLWFADLWDSINGGVAGKQWDANPWVWVVNFERRNSHE